MTTLNKLHHLIDYHLHQNDHRWRQLLSINDTNKYFKVFSQCVEKAALEFGGIESGQAKYKGRGTINIKTQTEEPRARYEPEFDQMITPLSQEASRLLKQHRRLIAIRNNHKSATSASTCPSSEHKKHTYRKQIADNIKLVKHIWKKHDKHNEVIESIDPANLDTIPNYCTITRIAEELLHRCQAMTRQDTKTQNKHSNIKYQTKGAHKIISRALRAKQPAPMSSLARQKDSGEGKPKGSITTNPLEIDEILHEVWDPITHGNCSDPELAATSFTTKYRKHIYKAREFLVNDITVEDFKEQCRIDTDSALGLDGWAASDLQLLSNYGYQILVDMLNAIEHGADWPTAMRVTRAVFLSKDSEDTQNPLAQRILKITSGIYRKWGSLRMRHLRPWIQAWDDDAIHAGTPGKGAADAWMNTAIDLEEAKAKLQKIAGGSIDVYKCFDQLNKPLIFKLAKEAGMPDRVLQAYMKYINNIEVRFQIGRTIGKHHQDPASLPQGCPFSMAMVALLFKPWLSVMKQAKVTPRCLADDLMLIATGQEHQSRYINAMQLTRTFFTDIGAKIADKKCFSFAGDETTRQFLSKYEWDHEGLQIPTVSNFRDTGTHLNLSHSNTGKTLTDRLQKARQMAKRLGWINHTLKKNVSYYPTYYQLVFMVSRPHG